MVVTRSRFLVYFRFILARRPPTHHNRGVEPNPEVGSALQWNDGVGMGKLWGDYWWRGGGGHPLLFFSPPLLSSEIPGSLKRKEQGEELKEIGQI